MVIYRPKTKHRIIIDSADDILFIRECLKQVFELEETSADDAEKIDEILSVFQEAFEYIVYL